MNLQDFIQKELPSIIRRNFILLIGATIIAAVGTYAITKFVPTVYEAKARLLIGPNLESPSTDFDALRIGSGLVQTYAELAETHPVLNSINDKLDLDLNAIEIDEQVEIRSNVDTRIITLVVQFDDPNTAIDIANSLSDSLLGLSPSTVEESEPLQAQLLKNIFLIQETIQDTQLYIEALQAELKNIQARTIDISQEDIFRINR
ncbi:MAG: Wzz/FepE/Etk N-terminal domain-containing protein, partial [Chloroflexota bacterium]